MNSIFSVGPGFGSLLILFAGSIAGCSDLTSKLPHARQYQVVNERTLDLSAGRTGRMWEITSSAKTFDEMAQTCMLAAKELSGKYSDDLTNVMLVPDKQLCGTRLRNL